MTCGLPASGHVWRRTALTPRRNRVLHCRRRTAVMFLCISRSGRPRPPRRKHAG